INVYFFFQAEDGIRGFHVTGVQTCALPICNLNFRVTWICLLICLLGGGHALAQYENERDATIPLEYCYIKRTGPSLLRTLLSKVTWGVSTGYGHTVFSHDLSGYGIAQNPGASPVIFNGTQVAAGYSNWFNRVVTTPNT